MRPYVLVLLCWASFLLLGIAFAGWQSAHSEASRHDPCFILQNHYGRLAVEGSQGLSSQWARYHCTWPTDSVKLAP